MRIHWVAYITRAPSYRWPDRGSLRARLRRWWLHTVKRCPDESCDACGGEVSTTYWAGDNDWVRSYTTAMNYPPFQRDWGVWSGLLCEPCFDAATEAS